FAFTDHHGVGVLHHFAGQERRMRPTNHDGDIAFTKLTRDFISVRRGRSVGRDADKVYLFIEINSLDDLVRVTDLPMFWSVSSEQWHRELRKPDQSPVTHEPRSLRFRRDQ